uniref:F-box domain-containing protein n=1 Tax=Knipowitschia caucasica TaxID=637954 RepID=A0AAV2JFE8_KNICA
MAGCDPLSEDIEVIVSDVGKDSAAQRKDSGAQRNTNTWHSDTGHSDTGPSDTGPSETGPSDTGPSDTRPSDTRPSDTQPSDTRPSNTGPSDSELGAVGGVASGAQRQWALTDALFHEKPLSNDVLHKHSPVVASGPPRLPRHALVPQPPRAAHVTRVPPPVPPPVPLPPLPHVPLPPPPHVPLPQLPRPPLPQLPRPPLPQLPRVPLPHPPHVPLPVPVPFLISDQLARNQFLQHLPSELRFRYLEQKLQSADILRGMFSFSSRRALLAEPYLFRAKMEDKAVDTSDLEVAEDPMGLHGIDLITAALLFCLGDSPGGRGISDSRFVDGYHMDFGTQTFSFPSAILATDTMVGDMSSASACDHASPQLCNPSPFHTLRLDLMLECVARYQTRQRSMFTFVCGQLFRRDEFSSHFRNVHGDIHAGLSGWMEQRCPLAYYGCTFSQRRFCPQAQGARIIHDPHLGAFGLRPGGRGSEGARRPRPSDQLSSLPFEVLQHVARFLDSFSLCQLSRVSRTMREVCGSLLQLRGMVVLLWERRRREDGALSWAITDKVWRFSTAFGTVSEWKFANISSMADHLKKCRFNTVSRREEAVPLPCMCFTRELTREGRSLRAVLKPVA